MVPASAESVFERNETYRKYLQNLDVTVTLYNQVRETILDVEYPLIKQQLKDIDLEIEKAVKKLNWTSSGKTMYIYVDQSLHIQIRSVQRCTCTTELVWRVMISSLFSFFSPLSSLSFSPSSTIGVWEYIEATRDLVCDLERRVRLAKSNVDNMCTIMAGWCKTSLYKRKGDKKESLLHLEVIAFIIILQIERLSIGEP